MRTLSVIIPATDRPATLDRALLAIERAAEPPEQVLVIDQPPNLQSPAARNLGARQAEGDILVFVDADVEVHDDAFVRIRAAFDENPELAGLFGAYDDEPAGGSLISDFRNLLHHHVHHQAGGPARTFWTGLGAVRRDDFVELGGFDEKIAWIRDIEFGMRLRRNGGLIVLDPSIQCKHLKRWTLASMTETDLLRRGVPWLRLVLEGRADSTALNLGWRHRVGAGAAVVLVAALARRKLRLAASAFAVVTLADADFFALLLRRRGPRMLAAGVPLHVLHRLTSVAAVPVALAGHVLESRKRRRSELR